MGKAKDLTNRRFERLKVIRRVENKNYRAMWLCECDCGNRKVITSYQLLSGDTKSCGCLGKENRTKSRTKHHKTNTKLYYVWKGMKQRCYNPKNKYYYNYGGRGITICEEWKNDFGKFYEWAIKNGYDENALHKSCTIDRINNSGNYEPNNCRWVDMKTQSNNRRKRQKI